MPFSCLERHTQLVWTVLECLCFSGLMYGWGILTPVLKSDGLYASYCSPQNYSDQHYEAATTNPSLNRSSLNATNKPADQILLGVNSVFTDYEWQSIIEEHLQRQYKMITYPPTCQIQDVYLRTVRIMSTFIVGVLTLPLGCMFDCCGTLKLRVLAVFLFVGSTITMAFTSEGKAWLLYLAATFLGSSGVLILLTNLQVANLFGRYQAAAILIYHGACDSSSFILLLVKHSADTGLSFQSSFMFLTVGVVPLLVGTVAFLPKTRIPWPLPVNYLQRRTSFDEWIGEKSKGNRRVQPFHLLVLSPLLLGQMLWFSVLNLRISLFSTTHATWLYTMAPPVSNDGHFYIISQLFGICVSFLAILTNIRRFSPRKDEQSMAAAVSICLIIYCAVFVSAVTLCIGSLLLRAEARYPVYILQLVTRVLLHGSNSLFLVMWYPFEHFGKLLGLTHSVGAILGLVQLPLSNLIDIHPNSLKIINALILVFVLTTSFQIFMMWRKRADIIRVPVTPRESDQPLREL